MTRTQHILLYGNSIFLSGLATQLQELSELKVRQQALHTGSLHLGGLDAVIVDLDEAPAGEVLSILRARPDLKVVGVNAPGGSVIVLSGKVYLAHSLGDVVICLQ